ncbi:MAG: hypothetical protein JWM84_3194 [Nocardioides sp.]|jgi:hypothetical protein|nr:hypothetical protein [Nocardioides sp.]
MPRPRIRLQTEENDPAEPTLRQSPPSNPTFPPTSNVSTQSVAPSVADGTSLPTVREPAADTSVAVAPASEDSERVGSGDVATTRTPPPRRTYRQPAAVTFTNRLSLQHRELLDQMAEQEGVTIRSLLEQALDLYKERVHPNL